MVVQDEIQRLGPSVDAMSKDGVMEAVLGQVCTTHIHRRQSNAMHWDTLSVLFGYPAAMFTAACSEL